jgi:regulator of replication initiation timing
VSEAGFSQLEKRIRGMVEELQRLRAENRQMQTMLAEIEQEKAKINQEREDVRRKINSLLALVESLEKENGKND